MAFPRSVKIATVFYFAPSVCIFAVGCHVLLSFLIDWLYPTAGKRCGKRITQVQCNYTTLAF